MATPEQILEDIAADHLPKAEARQKEQQEKADAEMAKWLEENRSYGVSFCTNSMLSRGEVAHCRIEGVMAIIEYEYGWWGPQYSERDYSNAGKVLGRITVDHSSNRAGKCLKCGGRREGSG